MTTTARQTPNGLKLEDGFRTLIAFAEAPDVNLWEKQVTPPGVDVGESIDVTDMHNEEWRTRTPRSLKTLTTSSFTAHYDPEVYESILDLIGKNGWISLHFPDGSVLNFVGVLRTFQPGPLSDGTPPEATCTIDPTNYLNGAEVDPEYVPANAS